MHNLLLLTAPHFAVQSVAAQVLQACFTQLHEHGVQYFWQLLGFNVLARAWTCCPVPCFQRYLYLHCVPAAAHTMWLLLQWLLIQLILAHSATAWLDGSGKPLQYFLFKSELVRACIASKSCTLEHVYKTAFGSLYRLCRGECSSESA